MKMNNIKYSFIFGFFTGLIIGLIDIFARIIIWSFEWFEIYQVFMISIGVVTVIFLILGIFVEVLQFILRKRIKEKRLSLSYFAASVGFLIIFYGLVLINIFLFPLPESNFSDPLYFAANLIIVLIAGGTDLFIIQRGTNLHKQPIVSIFKKRNVVNNVVFALIIFIVISFVIDIYNISVIPVLQGEKTDLPNILLITLDTTRPDHLGMYGYSMNTSPNMDELSSMGTVFDNVVSSSSWTLPGHASLFTGRYTYNNKVFEKRILKNDEILLAETLRENGYVTSGFIGGPFVKAKYGLAQGMLYHNDRLDFYEANSLVAFNKFSLKKVSYEVFTRIKDSFSSNLEVGDVEENKENETSNTEESSSVQSIQSIIFQSVNSVHDMIFQNDYERTCEEINRDVFSWLDYNHDKTFFLFINYFDPHNDYVLGKEFRHLFTNKTMDYNILKQTMSLDRYSDVSPEIIEYMTALYDTEIYYLDHNIGKLIHKLDDLSVLNDTIIIITADHGEEFYEHGGFNHKVTLYEEVVRIPLIIYYPEKIPAKKIQGRFSIVDIYPTILDILEIEPPDNLDGISLLSFIESDHVYNRSLIISELHATGYLVKDSANQIAIYYDNWKLINVTPEKRFVPSSLFNLEEDPNEKVNLFSFSSSKTKDMQKYIPY